jgi:hypothetical protein
MYAIETKILKMLLTLLLAVPCFLFYFISHKFKLNELYEHYLVVTCSLKTLIRSQVLVAHACNPSYSGGRDKDDHGSRPAQANSS